MRIMFGNWKYLAKNLLYVLPFAVVPAVFLALSLDYTAISGLTRAFFTGHPQAGFVAYLRAWSLLRIDSWGGAIYSVCALICIVFFMSLMLVFVEKHMRLGKRSLSGVFSQLGNVILSSTAITLAYFVMFEIWAIILSALSFAIVSIHENALVYILLIAVTCAFIYVLLFLATVLYLWLPCRQMTGFGAYDAFIYSYTLTVGIRGKLVLAFLISYAAFFFTVLGCSFLPAYAFRLIAIVLFAVLFLSFTLRMETAYFAADKLDREDIIRSYREL